MTKAEIRDILSDVLEREFEEIDVPLPSDWSDLEEKLSTRFPIEFKHFMDLMTEFSFPGDILNVRSEEGPMGMILLR